MANMLARCALLFCGGTFALATTPTGPAAPYVNLGTTTAVEALLDRQLPGARAHFDLELATLCEGGAQPPCFSLSDTATGGIKVTATGAAELASGVGHYFREHCNMVIGWKRGEFAEPSSCALLVPKLQVL
jgi:hypothetical protein